MASKEPKKTSAKHSLIDKANATVVGVTSAAVFVVIFSLVACHTLLNQFTYQNRIIKASKTTLRVLKDDINAVGELEDAYQAFVNQPQNALGGDPSGTAAQDGDNAKITLDALPSQYDFPALATSLQNILNGQGVQIQAISGTDNEVSQDTGAVNNPTPIAIPFQISVTGKYDAIQNVISAFDHSIRPIQIQTMTLTGDQNNLTLTLTAQTFYQPAKALNISTKVVK
ncbi:MAG TPA: type 4a pilus biogenesis protein PilO [Candidatus Saccharimonadales bacterium]|nr:type 4a pilus biogenesis protein PilO [Candidatus Saccharimonadales bacterium]